MPLYALDDVRPRLPSSGSAWIAPDAHVVGLVDLGENVGIWFGAVLRGDNELIRVGHDSNVQDVAVLHTDPGFPLTIGQGCTVGHGAVLHGCIIGDHCLIGMGATVMNGVRIGAGSIVGANALVTEGKVFPDRSLIVGAPAKAVRTLDEATAMELERAAAHYVDNARRYRAGLRRLD